MKILDEFKSRMVFSQYHVNFYTLLYRKLRSVVQPCLFVCMFATPNDIWDSHLISIKPCTCITFMQLEVATLLYLETALPKADIHENF